MSNPYYRLPGQAPPTTTENAQVHQLAKRARAATAAGRAARTTIVSIPGSSPSAPPSVNLTVDDPLSLVGNELSLPAASDSGGYIVMAGDLGGGGDAPVVVGLQSVPVDSATPATDDVLTYNGTEWAPAALPAPPSGLPDESWTAQSIDFTMSASAPNVAVDTSGGNRTVTLPQASAYLASAHPALTVKIHPGGNSITLTAHAGDDIDGSGTTVITNNLQTLTVKVRADGTGWLTMHPQP